MARGFETSRRRGPNGSTGLRTHSRRFGGTRNGHFLDSDAFEAELRRHRARLERAGWPFTLLAFSLPDAPMVRKDERRLKEALAKMVADRCRLTDVAGWHGMEVGLLLPGTSPQSVESIVSEVEKRFHENISRQGGEFWTHLELNCSVVYYPAELSEESYVAVRSVDL